MTLTVFGMWLGWLAVLLVFAKACHWIVGHKTVKAVLITAFLYPILAATAFHTGLVLLSNARRWTYASYLRKLREVDHTHPGL